MISLNVACSCHEGEELISTAGLMCFGQSTSSDG